MVLFKKPESVYDPAFSEGWIRIFVCSFLTRILNFTLEKNLKNEYFKELGPESWKNKVDCFCLYGKISNYCLLTYSSKKRKEKKTYQRRGIFVNPLFARLDLHGGGGIGGGGVVVVQMQQHLPTIHRLYLHLLLVVQILGTYYQERGRGDGKRDRQTKLEIERLRQKESLKKKMQRALK